MLLTLRIIGSIGFALFAAIGILVASSHLLPVLAVSALVALGALGVRLENRRPASGFGRGSAQYVLAIAVGFVVIAYAAIGMATLLGRRARGAGRRLRTGLSAVSLAASRLITRSEAGDHRSTGRN